MGGKVSLNSIIDGGIGYDLEAHYPETGATYDAPGRIRDLFGPITCAVTMSQVEVFQSGWYRLLEIILQNDIDRQNDVSGRFCINFKLIFK